MNWEAFWLTARLAAIVSTLLVAIGIPIAYWVTYSRWRWKFLVEAAVALPIVLPPTVLASMCSWRSAQAARSDAGGIAHRPHAGLHFRGPGDRSLLYSLPFAVQPFAASFGAVDRTLLQASASLGHSPLQTFRRIVLPSQKRADHGILRSASHTRWESLEWCSWWEAIFPA